MLLAATSQLMLACARAGLWAYRAAWVYGSLCMAVFMVRTMKRVIFYESRQYSEPPPRHCRFWHGNLHESLAAPPLTNHTSYPVYGHTCTDRGLLQATLWLLLLLLWGLAWFDQVVMLQAWTARAITTSCWPLVLFSTP